MFLHSKRPGGPDLPPLLALLERDDLSADLQLVADVIGLEATRALIERLYGMRFYVCRPWKLETLLERYVIGNIRVRDDGSTNIREMALVCGCSPAFVRNILIAHEVVLPHRQRDPEILRRRRADRDQEDRPNKITKPPGTPKGIQAGLGDGSNRSTRIGKTTRAKLREQRQEEPPKSAPVSAAPVEIHIKGGSLRGKRG